MLNRTNRTLTANLNRLNLGTRSLALQGGFNGKISVRARQAHAGAPRAGMPGSFDPSIRHSSWIEPSGILGSFSVESWPVATRSVRPPVGVSVSPPVPTVRTRAAVAVCSTGTGQGQGWVNLATWLVRGGSKPSRVKPGTTRPEPRSAFGKPAAAAVAAAGG